MDAAQWDGRFPDGIPEFVWCGNCHTARDLIFYDGIFYVETCEGCGDDGYEFSIQAESESPPPASDGRKKE